jgi:hypothetical protein
MLLTYFLVLLKINTLKRLYIYLIAIWLITFLPNNIFAQSDTFKVQFPELFAGLDSLGISIFDNTDCLKSAEGEYRYELLMGVYKKYPMAETPVLLKRNKIWYVTYSGTGLLFEILNDRNIAVRLDNTCQFGYNYGQFASVIDGQIISFGGYGFWNINGIFRSYVYANKNWEIINTINPDIEISMLYYSSYIQICQGNENTKIYVGNVIKHKKTTNTFDYLKDCYVLNLVKHDWQYLGVTNDQFKDIKYVHQTNSGSIVSNKGEILIIDFLSNSVKQLNPRITASHLTNIVDYKYKRTYYLNDTTLSVFDFETRQWTTTTLKTSDWINRGELYHKPFNYTLLYIVIIILVLGVGIVFLIYFKKKKVEVDEVNQQMDMLQLQPVVESEHWVDIISANEREFLKMIIEAGNKISTEEINKVLGVNNKSAEVQKFHRHKIVASINKSFSSYYRTADELIIRTRSELDKRSYQYHINTDHLSTIKEGF